MWPPDNTPEVEMALERKELAKRFLRLPRLFSIMLDSDMTLQTWSDIGQHPEPKMATMRKRKFLPVSWPTF